MVKERLGGGTPPPARYTVPGCPPCGGHPRNAPGPAAPGKNAALFLSFFLFFSGAEVPAQEAVLSPANAAFHAAAPVPGPASPEGRPLRARPRQDGGGEAAQPPGGPYAGTGAAGPEIPGLDRPLTEQYLARYSSPSGLRWLSEVMRNAGPWLPFIREEIARRGLPPELLYLPVIESSFRPTALSRSGAAGLWQFMRNSIAPFGITISYWLDERLDFWKSTQGALAKLAENHRRLDDWALALAAYNMGMGGLERIIRRTGIRDYWELSAKNLVSTENAHYVPKFLAAARILQNPRRFGLDLDWSADPRWVRIRAGRHIDLEKLALAAEIDPAILRAANAECIRGITPADPSHYIKVPAASLDAVAAVLAAAGAETAPVFPRIHTVRQGESLWAIGRLYGVSPETLAETNGMKTGDILREGRTLNIPIME